jgi:hypothetical protein
VTSQGDTVSTQLWIISRHDPDRDPEHLAATTDEAEARAVAAALGEGHSTALAQLPTEVVVPMLTPGAGHRVVAWWRCQAVVRADTVEIGEPTRLAGAARLLHPGEVVEGEEQVREDLAAGELARAVHGEQVRHATALALSARRARELAEQWARAAAGDTDPEA